MTARPEKDVPPPLLASSQTPGLSDAENLLHLTDQGGSSWNWSHLKISPNGLLCTENEGIPLANLDHLLHERMHLVRTPTVHHFMFIGSQHLRYCRAIRMIIVWSRGNSHRVGIVTAYSFSKWEYIPKPWVAIVTRDIGFNMTYHNAPSAELPRQIKPDDHIGLVEQIFDPPQKTALRDSGRLGHNRLNIGLSLRKGAFCA